MMTKVSADATICGCKDIITVTKDGKIIKVEMTSGCPHIKKTPRN